MGDTYEIDEIPYQEERPFTDDEKFIVHSQSRIQFDEDLSRIYKSITSRLSENMEHELRTFVDSGKLDPSWLSLAAIDVEVMVEEAAKIRGPLPDFILENEHDEPEEPLPHPDPHHRPQILMSLSPVVEDATLPVPNDMLTMGMNNLTATAISGTGAMPLFLN